MDVGRPAEQAYGASAEERVDHVGAAEMGRVEQHLLQTLGGSQIALRSPGVGSSWMGPSGI